MEVVFAKESDSWEIKTLAAGILKMATLHRNTGIILVKKDILARLFDFFSTCETPVRPVYEISMYTTQKHKPLSCSCQVKLH